MTAECVINGWHDRPARREDLPQWWHFDRPTAQRACRQRPRPTWCLTAQEPKLAVMALTGERIALWEPKSPGEG